MRLAIVSVKVKWRTVWSEINGTAGYVTALAVGNADRKVVAIYERDCRDPVSISKYRNDVCITNHHSNRGYRQQIV
jgi:hypothetical protein